MKRIPHQALQVLERLEHAGFEAYLVGGCVRDLLLGREPQDWDMTTSARPEETLAIFEGYAIPTGLQHGTVTVCLDGYAFEVTTFRVDGTYGDHRHPDSVTFTADLREDLKRRDFTINAMAMDRSGEIEDLFGGRKDLKDCVLRCVGRPDVRFGEDALRILRAVRFSSTLGFAIEKDTAEAVHTLAPNLSGVAAERIREELLKLLCGKDVVRILLGYPDVLGVFMPELLPAVGCDQRNHHHCYDVWEHIARTVGHIAPEGVLRMTMLLHDLGKPPCMTVDEQGVGHFRGHAEASCDMGRDILDRLRFDNDSADRIMKLVKWHGVPIEATERAMRRALNKMGVEAAWDLLRVKRADNLAQAPAYLGRQQEIDELEALLRSILDQDACFSLRQLAVNGDDLVARGYHGKAVGRNLRDLLEQVIDGKLPNDREILLANLETKSEEKTV